MIHIEKQLVQTRVKGQDYVFGTLKNGKTRVIAPAPFVMEVLKKHKADQEEQKREMGDLWDEGKFPGLVFNHPDGSHYSQPTIWKEFQNILAAAGLEHHRVHDLRHPDVKQATKNNGWNQAGFGVRNTIVFCGGWMIGKRQVLGFISEKASWRDDSILMRLSWKT